MTNPTANLLSRAPVTPREAETVKALRRLLDLVERGEDYTEALQQAHRALAQYDTGAKP